MPIYVANFARANLAYERCFHWQVRQGNTRKRECYLISYFIVFVFCEMIPIKAPLELEHGVQLA